MPPPFPVSEYIVDNSNRLDARRFEAMQDAGAVEEFHDRNVTRHLTATGGWRKRLNHWGGRGCLNAEVLYENLFMKYIRFE